MNRKQHVYIPHYGPQTSKMNAYFLGICFLYIINALYNQLLVSDVLSHPWIENTKSIQSLLQKHRYFFLIPKQYSIATCKTTYIVFA